MILGTAAMTYCSFSSLITAGTKLFLNRDVLTQMLLYVLPDLIKENRLRRMSGVLCDAVSFACASLAVHFLQ